MTIKSLSLSSPKKAWVISIFLILLLVPIVSFAGINWEEIVGNIIYWAFFWPFVLIMQLEMVLLPIVAQYSDFVREAKVRETWMILRDLANMFFIVFLLVMSFGTILQLKSYGYKNMLSGILIMAILVNFSRSIIGLVVDFVQIIMLTFVAAWKDVAASSFQTALGLYGTLNLRSSGDGFSFANFISGVFLGGIMLIVAVVLIGAFLAILVGRIVTLWILTILSPLAFLAYASPQTKKYYTQWESELTKTLIIGPALAFFLWLTFTITGDGQISKQIVKPELRASLQSTSVSTGSVNSTIEQGLQGGGPTQATTIDSFLNYIVAIALLAAGLKFASQSGVAGAGMARAGLSKLEGYASKANKFAGDKTIGRVERIYDAAGTRAVAVGGKLRGGLAGIAIDKKGEARALGKAAIIGGAFQRGAIRSRGTDEKRRDTRIKQELEGIPASMREAYLRSRAGAGGMGSRKQARALTAADKRSRQTQRVLSAGGSTDYEFALAQSMGKPGRKLDTEQIAELVRLLRNGGDVEGVKNLQSRYANAYNREEANEAVAEKGAKVVESLRGEGIADENGNVTDGFKHLLSSLLDPTSKVAHTEIVEALKRMDKAAQKTAKQAMKDMGMSIEALAEDASNKVDAFKRKKNKVTGADEGIEKNPDGSIKLNTDSAAVKMVGVAGNFNPADVATRIEAVAADAWARAKTPEDKASLGDKGEILRKTLYNSAVAKADFGSLNMIDLPEMNTVGSNDEKLLIEYAKRASSEQQRQFMLANKDIEILRKFVGILAGAGVAVNSIVRNTAFPRTEASGPGAGKKKGPSDEGFRSAQKEFKETGAVRPRGSMAGADTEDTSAEDEES